ncbi:type II secretion system F family protein [Erythrobacter mangrovi]|uniref:Type II secretion system F family protein n=1 Tax=Erythrobacter mangrovi TaxID=2739433 RepID=A0A7D3XRI7_9SPHN|nr:type II secretion system F family protein [Erythrobacter mangrovi]QKG71131.1 type II secretion system F family protein [Erythrobacter mangrovi]
MLSGDLTRLLILLAVFASIFLASQLFLRAAVEGRAHIGAVNKRLKLIATGHKREEILGALRKHDPMANPLNFGILGPLYSAFQRNLLMAAVPFGFAQILLGMAAFFALVMLVVTVLALSSGYTLTLGVIQLIIAVALATAVGLPVLAVSYLAQRRRKTMQEQFPVALDIFVRALRSGHPVSSAIELLTQEMNDPIGTEFGLIADEISYGADLNEALDDMAERWDLDDLRMFSVSLSVQNETGGNLAEILDSLSKVIRERASLYLKVRALSSEGRMTGWLLTGLPVLTFVILFSMNPQFYLEVAGDPIFMIGFPAMILWFFVGVFWIKNLVNLKV